MPQHEAVDERPVQRQVQVWSDAGDGAQQAGSRRGGVQLGLGAVRDRRERASAACRAWMVLASAAVNSPGGTFRRAQTGAQSVVKSACARVRRRRRCDGGCAPCPARATAALLVALLALARSPCPARQPRSWGEQAGGAPDEREQLLRQPLLQLLQDVERREIRRLLHEQPSSSSRTGEVSTPICRFAPGHRRRVIDKLITDNHARVLTQTCRAYYDTMSGGSPVSSNAELCAMRDVGSMSEARSSGGRRVGTRSAPPRGGGGGDAFGMLTSSTPLALEREQLLSAARTACACVSAQRVGRQPDAPLAGAAAAGGR